MRGRAQGIMKTAKCYEHRAATIRERTQAPPRVGTSNLRRDLGPLPNGRGSVLALRKLLSGESGRRGQRTQAPRLRRRPAADSLILIVVLQSQMRDEVFAS